MAKELSTIKSKTKEEYFIEEISNPVNIQVVTKEEEEPKRYMQYFLDLDKPIKEDNFLFEINGIPRIAEGEVITITGQPKNGKSQFSYLLVAAALVGTQVGHIYPRRSDYKILMFDTEQSAASVSACSRRAFNTAGIKYGNHERFKPFLVKIPNIAELRSVVEEAIEAEKPDIVFLDNLGDFIRDFNNNIESLELKNWLFKLKETYNCTIICVVHQNKNKDNATMQGHMGTKMGQAMVDCFEVAKDSKDNHFIVKNTSTRFMDPELGPVEEFKIEDDVYVPMMTDADRLGKGIVAEIRRNFETCFGKDRKMGGAALRSLYMDKFEVSKTTYFNHRKVAIDSGFLESAEGDSLVLTWAEA